MKPLPDITQANLDLGEDVGYLLRGYLPEYLQRQLSMNLLNTRL